MSNILELYSKPNLKGDSQRLQADCGDLSSVGFLKRAQSLKVIGAPWIVFTGTQYRGEFTHYREGTFNIPGFANDISSVRVVTGGLLTPKITLYEFPQNEGKTVTLEERKDGFNNVISSHKTERGAWILYNGEDYNGSRMVTVAGDMVPNYISPDWKNGSCLIPSWRSPFC
uniref:Beta/gamma crystallin 'Greek key' domain-containing protein n=1 Tax=Xenopus tropicalis TaxID=8364 RepID=A0A803JNE4_XENTR